MKTSKEMADSVFKIRDEYEEKQRKKRIIRKKAVYAVSTACMFGAIFIGIKYTSLMKHNIPEVAVVDTTNATENIEDTHQTTKVTGTVPTDSTYTNTESTKESKINNVTEASSTEPTENKETDTDTPTTEESDINEKETDEPTHIQTEPVSEKTEPIITETKAPEITELVSSGDTAVQNSTTPSGDDSPIVGPEAIPSSTDWDSLPMEKKYLEAILDSNIIYLYAEKELSSDMLGDFIAEVQMKGYDGEIEHLCKAKAYSIKNYSDNEAIAIKFDDVDRYYFYRFSTERN
jgi:hypothetical protein